MNTGTAYYMASSANGQDESNPSLWLATRAGKMELSCPLGTTCCVPQEHFPRKPYNKSFIDQACSVKMAGYWPRSFFCVFTGLDYISVHKHAKRNLANIQPSWQTLKIYILKPTDTVEPRFLRHHQDHNKSWYNPNVSLKVGLNLKTHHVLNIFSRLRFNSKLWQSIYF